MTEFNIETYPWPYAVIEDFYDWDLFNMMRDEILHRHISLKNEAEYRDQMKLKNKYLLDDNEIMKDTHKCITSRSLSQNQLNLFPNHRKHKDLILKSEICYAYDIKYPIHDDNSTKILTLVVYVSPETSHGTVIYDEHKNYVKEIEWKPNTALLFAPIDKITWHSWHSAPNTDRITVNSFLIDNERSILSTQEQKLLKLKEKYEIRHHNIAET